MKKIIRKTFLYKPLVFLYNKFKIFFHDSNLFPVIFIRKKVRKRQFEKFNDSPYPSIVHIETTNLCNAGCVMCPHDNMKRRTGMMDDDLYKKIIYECVRGKVENVWTFMMGEPLLDKDLQNKIIYAKEKGISNVGFFTNASLLNEEIAVKLLESRIDHITISFDALTEDTYKNIRPKLLYDTVSNNIKNFMELRKKRKLKKPFVAIEFVEMDKNKHETEAFRKKWEKIVDAVYVSLMLNWGREDYKNIALNDVHYRIRRPCPLLWKDLVVFIDGTVPLCCYDCDGEIFLGDIKKQRFDEIWTGKILSNIRRIHLSGEYDKISKCSKCNMWQSLSIPWWW